MGGAGVVAVAAVIVVMAVMFMGGSDDTPEVSDTTTQSAETDTAAVVDSVVDTEDATTADSEAEASEQAEEVAAEPTPVPEPTMTLAEAVAALDRLTERIESNVGTLRGLEIEVSVEPQLRTRAQLADITQGIFRREQIRQQLFEAEELYKVLGMLSDDADLEDLLLGIQLQQVYAMFDDETDTLYVLSDATSVGPLEELGFASAYMGSIQQELFDIGELRRRARVSSSDEFRAVTALISGDVRQIQDGYINEVMSSDEVQVLNEPLPDNLLTAAPAVVRKTVLFPHLEGAEFVANVFATTGTWDAVDQAYKNTPVSTEQVLHMEKYLIGEQPLQFTLPDLAAEMGRGWVEVSSDTMGEFMMRTYLEEHLDEVKAGQIAAGWGGDRYTLISGPEGERVLVSLAVWDTELDADEFFEGFQDFMAAKNPGAAGRPLNLGDTGRKWVTKDETVFLGKQLSGSILLIIGDTEELVGEVLGLLAS